MKVVLLNGSRREAGCTYTALSVVADVLKENGVDAEIIHAVPTERNYFLYGQAGRRGWLCSDPQTGLRRRIGSSGWHDSYAGRTE